jgi:predicted RNase H-like HicB family nuclease
MPHATKPSSQTPTFRKNQKFHVTLLEHDEGVSVSCPELPGCHSQGATIAEAMENIHDAIEGYLELYGEPDLRCQVREMEVITA